MFYYMYIYIYMCITVSLLAKERKNFVSWAPFLMIFVPFDVTSVIQGRCPLLARSRPSSDHRELPKRG